MEHPWKYTAEEILSQGLILPPIDNHGIILKVGDRVKFMTLYGLREVVVKKITLDKEEPYLWQSPYILHFDEIQVGPEEAFKPISQWHVYRGMMSCYHADHYDLDDEATIAWLNTFCFSLSQGTPYGLTVYWAARNGEDVRKEVLVQFLGHPEYLSYKPDEDKWVRDALDKITGKNRR